MEENNKNKTKPEEYKKEDAIEDERYEEVIEEKNYRDGQEDSLNKEDNQYEDRYSKEKELTNNAKPDTVADKFAIDNVKVNFPVLIEHPINSYMLYKINYRYKGNEFVIDRRFSDFTSLRDSLRKFLPCHYIFPTHKKKSIVN